MQTAKDIKRVFRSFSSPERPSALALPAPPSASHSPPSSPDSAPPPPAPEMLTFPAATSAPPPSRRAHDAANPQHPQPQPNNIVISHSGPACADAPPANKENSAPTVAMLSVAQMPDRKPAAVGAAATGAVRAGMVPAVQKTKLPPMHLDVDPRRRYGRFEPAGEGGSGGVYFAQSLRSDTVGCGCGSGAGPGHLEGRGARTVAI